MPFTPGQWLADMLRWPQRRILEPLDGYWLGDPSWGQRYAAPLAQPGLGAPGAVVPVARLDRIPGPPRPYTIRLFRSGGFPDGLSGPGAFAALRARITVGCGGQNTQFVVDWAHGTQFTVVASSIVVEAVQEGTFAVSPVYPTILAAAFGQGACARGNATYTIMPPLIAPGAQAGVAEWTTIPQYASHFELYATTDTGIGGWVVNRDPLNQVEQYIFPPAIRPIVNTFADAELRTYPGVRLHPEINSVVIRSQAGAVAYSSLTIVFNLTGM